MFKGWYLDVCGFACNICRIMLDLREAVWRATPDHPQATHGSLLWGLFLALLRDPAIMGIYDGDGTWASCR